MNTTSHSEDIPPIPEELKEYANVIRNSIAKGDCDLFRNSSREHAAVIMQLFCEAAQQTICIFCGRLNEVVYGRLLPVVREALSRGVSVRVLTETDKVQSKELAEGLREADAWRIAGAESEGLPHFAVIDGRMLRLELSQNQGSAMVRTNIAPDDNVGKERVALIEKAFDTLWSSASVPTVPVES